MRLATASALLTHVASAGIASLSARPDDSEESSSPESVVLHEQTNGEHNQNHTHLMQKYVY